MLIITRATHSYQVDRVFETPELAYVSGFGQA